MYHVLTVLRYLIRSDFQSVAITANTVERPEANRWFCLRLLLFAIHLARQMINLHRPHGRMGFPIEKELYTRNWRTTNVDVELITTQQQKGNQPWTNRTEYSPNKFPKQICLDRTFKFLLEEGKFKTAPLLDYSWILRLTSINADALIPNAITFYF